MMVGPAAYVRTCRLCGATDTHSLFGRAEMVDEDEPWGCRFCPSTVWCLDRLTAETRRGR
jgi:hypothetical protein